MSIVMTKTTRSPILCEAKDFVTGLYDAKGKMLEQTENLPILSFSLGPVCEYIVKYFGEEIYPGDVIFHNDVFSMGNQNNDVAVYKPIFYKDKLLKHFIVLILKNKFQTGFFGNPEIFLTRDKVAENELEANAPVIVDEPPPLPGR